MRQQRSLFQTAVCSILKQFLPILTLWKLYDNTVGFVFCEVNWLFNVTINDISVIHVTAHRCAGGLKKWLDLRSDSQRHRHLMCPSKHRHGTTLFIRWFRHIAPLVAFNYTLGIRRTYSRPSRGVCFVNRSYFRLCIALFAVAEGWLLLDIGWFVLLLEHVTPKQFSTCTW